jgi:hypothetical protein
VVGAIQASGVTVSYDIWNEPDQSAYWSGGVDTQYFEMWNAAVDEIRTLAPDAGIIGPSLSADPSQDSSEWTTWLSTLKADGTLPTEISDHRQRHRPGAGLVHERGHRDLADRAWPVPWQ